MQKLQSQGVHHITIVGAGRQTSIDFWEGVLGMPFVFEQPNLDNESESHLYFDPGDGRLITIFTNEEREADPSRTPTDPGCVHHVAFALSQATFYQAVERLSNTLCCRAPLRSVSASSTGDREEPPLPHLHEARRDQPRRAGRRGPAPRGVTAPAGRP